MAETTADVRRDIEMTRERISTTLAQLEQKTNVVQIVRDHPWPALAAAVGVGVLLSGTRADVKAAGATVAATKGASSKLGGVLDEAMAKLMGGFQQAFQGHVDSLVDDVRKALGTTSLPVVAGGSAGAGSDTVAQLMSAGNAGSSRGAGDGALAATSAAWAPHTSDDVSASEVVSANSPAGRPGSQSSARAD